MQLWDGKAGSLTKLDQKETGSMKLNLKLILFSVVAVCFLVSMHKDQCSSTSLRRPRAQLWDGKDGSLTTLDQTETGSMKLNLTLILLSVVAV